MLRNHLNESNASSNSKTNNNMSNTKAVGTSSTKTVTPTFTWPVFDIHLEKLNRPKFIIYHRICQTIPHVRLIDKLSYHVINREHKIFLCRFS